MYKDRKRIYINGYVFVENPEHPRACLCSYGFHGVYEHVLVAELYVLGRLLQDGEVVHHLDSNRSNNSPDNLLVLYRSMHTKLHTWINKHVLVPSPAYQERKDKGCVRCVICETPVMPSYKFCNPDCAEAYKLLPRDNPGIGNIPSRYVGVTKESLSHLVWSKPTTHVAKEFGVSDKAIEKLCVKLGVEKPPRGYWAKQASMTKN